MGKAGMLATVAAAAVMVIVGTCAARAAGNYDVTITGGASANGAWEPRELRDHSGRALLGAAGLRYSNLH